MPGIIEICENLKVHSQALRQSSTEIFSKEASEIDKPVRNVLLRGSEIIRGGADLGKTKNPTALGIITRQLVELLISLQWIISSPERAEKYSDFSLNELDRVAQIVMNDGLLSVKAREDGTDVTKEFLAKREKAKKGVSIEQQARESDLIHIYQVLYRFMSLDTHGKSETIVDPEESLEATLVQLQTIGAISQAFGHIAILWLMHRQKTDNETIRELLGLNEQAA
ncbi:DUF5677 domain-containing protein [Thalassolituus pacificus]|uniref:DUF5677 domain-containing protein n=1 Tax=Thalassolituus pacificus TaxID=2975440 RepID=A0A9X2WCP6_9GAMM|nr:DUF5677 domain-containing protein [Thalassolituus pacificus]